MKEMNTKKAVEYILKKEKMSHYRMSKMMSEGFDTSVQPIQIANWVKGIHTMNAVNAGKFFKLWGIKITGAYISKGKRAA